jgi:glycosyltransferase involved in cell wall biosynthesis
MLVSIIVNNFNYARFLETAIRSALSQTYDNVEVIVVDDGSTDDSRSVINRFGNQVRAVCKKNGGQGSAFNSGFAASRGDLIIFLDADDALKPDAARTAVQSWSEHFSKLHYPLDAIDEKGEALNELFPAQPLAGGDVLPQLLQEGDYCTPPTSGNVFPRWFLASVMPIPEAEWRDCADCYLMQSAPFYGHIGLVESTLGQYRLHGASMTAETAGGRLRLQSLQNRLHSDQRKQRLLDRLSVAHGRSMTPAAVLNSYHHLKARLISRKLGKAAHPFPNDRLPNIAWRLLQRVWRHSSLSLTTRLAFTLWAVALVVLPRAACERLALIACSPHSSSKVRKALVRVAPSEASEMAHT